MHSNHPIEDRTWFEFKAVKNDEPAEILIYDYIGSYGVSATGFDAGLKAIGKVAKATMRINSPGGDTPTAASIYNMLERWKAKHGVELTVVVDGIAASAASWIAMLGDDIVMPENALMMIHDPSGFAIGTSREMKAMAGVLERIKQGMVSAYMKKSGLTEEEVSSIMEDETWYSAQEAVDAGFADRVDNPIEIAASFDLTRFKNPPTPEVARDRTVASQETNPMVTKPNETAAEMEARLRAEITASLTPAATTVVAAATTPVVVPETQAQMETRVRAEIEGKHSEITSLCAIAGKPDRAAAFIAAGKTVVEVRAALETEAKAAPKTQQQAPNAHVGAAAAVISDDAVKELSSAPIDAYAVYANLNKGKGTPVSYLKH